MVTNPAWPGFVKIGSAIDVGKRLVSYQTACPHRAFKLEACAYVSDRVGEERRVMGMLERYRHQGEWFRVEPEVAIRLVESFRKRGTCDAART